MSSPSAGPARASFGTWNNKSRDRGRVDPSPALLSPDRERLLRSRPPAEESAAFAEPLDAFDEVLVEHSHL